MSETGDPALIGRRVAGKFLVEKFLGGGAMGGVYRAKDSTLDRSVALKVMHPALAIDPSFVKRFHREARAASRIDHPNAMRVIEFGEEPDGLLYIAMEYLEGRDLYKVIHEDWPLPEPRIADMMIKALSAMQVAHDMGVIHRDLKPENIMILDRKDDEDRDIVKVCDFGIAKITESDDESASRKATGAKLTTSGLVVGTPEYMSPEQARGEKLDARSDLYSLGIILYQLLTGRTPFLADTALAVVLKHITETPEPPRTVYPNVHKGLEQVCMKALLKEKADRFQSARDMRAAIRAVMDGRAMPVDMVAPTLAETAPSTGPSQPRPSSSGPTAPHPISHAAIQTAPNASHGSGPPVAPAVMVSKTTPLGTAVVASSPPPRPASRAPLLIAVGLAAVLIGALGVVGLKSKLATPSDTHATTALTATEVAKSAEVPSAKESPAPTPEPTVEASALPKASAAPVRRPKPTGPNASPQNEPEPEPVPVPVPDLRTPASAPPPASAEKPAEKASPAPAPAPAPAAAAFNPSACKAVLGPKRGVNGTHPQDLTLSGTDAAWTSCAKSSIKDKPAAPIAATVRLKFSDNRAFRGASCTGCTPALSQCIATSTGATARLTVKSGDVSGEPDFDVPVTFSCD